MNNIARPKLIIEVKALEGSDTDKQPEKGKKVAADPRIQKLNTILGPRGIRADELLKKFDTLTSEYEPGTPIPLYLEIVVDQKGKSLEYKMRLGMIPTSYLVKKKLRLEKLAQKPNIKNPIAIVDKKFVNDIVAEKIKLMPQAQNYDELFKCIVGSLLSAGIKYQEHS